MSHRREDGSDRRPELPDVWEGPEPEERVGAFSGLADVYEGPEPDESVGPRPARPIDVGAGLAEIYEAVRRSEESDDESDDAFEDESKGGGVGSTGADAIAESLFVRVEPDRRADEELSRPDVTLVHHVLVPVATISMVGALLFFLLDLRSAFVGGSFSLKWIGLCFAVATVLIARYGRLMGGGDHGALYSALLGVATFFAMLASPWEPPQTRFWGPLLNGIVLYVTWRFAGRLTRDLSADLDDRTTRRRRLYGMERVALESWRRQQVAEGKASGRFSAQAYGLRSRGVRSDSEAALRSVARLTLLGLLLFVAGEPVLRVAEPELAGQALAAMTWFLLSAGVLLGAASVAAQQRRLERLQASAPWTLVTGRVAAGLLMTLLVLALALQLPGVRLVGSGLLQPAAAADGRSSDGETRAAGPESQESPGDRSPVEPESAPGESADAAGSRDPAAETTRDGGARATSFDLVSMLAQVGSWLKWPLVAVVVLAVLAMAVRWAARQKRFLPALGEVVRGLLGGLASRLGGLGVFWQNAWRRLRRRAESRGRRGGDPFAALAELGRQEPGPAVVGAYTVLQSALADLGHARSPEQTPIEYLQGMPGILNRLKPAAGRLTRLYLLAAYAPVAVGDAQRKQAVDALEELRLAAKLHADEIRR